MKHHMRHFELPKIYGTTTVGERGQVVIPSAIRKKMKIESGEIVSRIFGSGAYTLTGTTTRQIIHIIGSGSYKAPHLQSLQAGVRITGSGDVLVNVREELNASVIGSGEIRYIGDPFISEESVQGSGTILRTRNEMGAEVGNLELLEQLKKIDAVTYPKIEQI